MGNKGVELEEDLIVGAGTGYRVLEGNSKPVLLGGEPEGGEQEHDGDDPGGPDEGLEEADWVDEELKRRRR